ncbi:MAG: hypothetical protein KAR40_10345 [Candidatus Sabulitectum sp.]|nr:hypothetical protein [Candidatus Sabulitectum sp.]
MLIFELLAVALQGKELPSCGKYQCLGPGWPDGQWGIPQADDTSGGPK